MHLLSLFQSFILNLSLSSLANPFHSDLFLTYQTDSTNSIYVYFIYNIHLISIKVPNNKYTSGQ